MHDPTKCIAQSGAASLASATARVGQLIYDQGMCGIAGQLDFGIAGPDRAAVAAMSRALAHRGPDGQGTYSEGPVALAHRRLAIIDLSGGAQPQVSADGELAVVFNGEIYNFAQLRGELGAASFRTHSDTEVLLHLYAAQGEAMLERLEGMFAFALWDRRRQRLLLARDRFGEKPLLFSAVDGRLSFASELGALRRALGEPALDRQALGEYLELLYVPAPRTIYTGVEKLPAAHCLIADRGGVEVHRWWSPPVPGSRRGPPPAPAEVRRALASAVELRLVSDVPVGALLSGGIDSSAVVGLMAEQRGPGIQTFSVGFGREDDELPQARLVAERWRTDHRELLVTGDLAGQVLEGLSAYSEPFGDSSAVPTVAVCRAVAQSVKVVLTGDGGDELFAGYGLTRRLRQLRALPRLPGFGRAGQALGQLPERLPGSAWRRRLDRLGRVLASPPARRHRALSEVFSSAERRQLLRSGQPSARAVAPGLRSPADPVEAALAFDLDVYLPDDLLLKADGAAMHFGLEGRAPFLDTRLAELVVPSPARHKVSATEGKLLLRQAVEDLVPQAILARPKRGFGSPVDVWLAGPLRPMLHDLLGSSAAWVRTQLDGTAIDKVVSQVGAGRGNGHQAWALLALECWARGGA